MNDGKRIQLSGQRLTYNYRRGKSGGQVRDEYREEYDPGRGGYGRAYDEQRQREEEQYGEGR